ncbi:minor capsid protein [Amycolatopsis circi]|uniref:minor capsid protein n=1 Tax=Amycolatopsis circi TaxID=871959 RepID=UPI000E27992F|nr:minor capsid protein [Amycolatopsis circi]
MSFLAELGDILARHLAAVGAGVYRPDGVYTPGETGIVFGAIPAEPPQVVALLLYPLTADTDADAEYGLRIRYRSAGQDPRDALDLVDVAFDALAGAGEQQLGLGVHLVTRETSNPSGTDQNGRYLHTDTYNIRAHHPTRYRE